MTSASCCARSATRADSAILFDSHRSWYVGESCNDDCLNSEIIALGRYYVDTRAVPPRSSWDHPLGPPPSPPSPPPGSYTPPSNSHQNHSYGGIGGPPPYGQQQGQPYSEQYLNVPQSYGSYPTSTEKLPVRLSDSSLGGNPFSPSGIHPQEPHVYWQEGYLPEQGYAGPPSGNYGNPGWQQGTHHSLPTEGSDTQSFQSQGTLYSRRHTLCSSRHAVDVEVRTICRGA